MKKLILVAALLVMSSSAFAEKYVICNGETSSNCGVFDIPQKPYKAIAVPAVECSDANPCAPKGLTGNEAVKLGEFLRKLFGNRQPVDDTAQYMRAGQ